MVRIAIVFAAATWGISCGQPAREHGRQLGDRYERGDRAPRDYARAAAAYQEACDASPGDGRACWKLAQLVSHCQKRWNQYERIAALARRGCYLDDSVSCVGL